MANIVLAYTSSTEIVRFISEHPIDWRDVHLARLGAPGDLLTPEPAMLLFFRLLAHRLGRLFTQEQYVEYCLRRWEDWIETLTDEQYRGIQARLGCNFYVSGINTLHVWAMLVELGVCSYCSVDVLSDVRKKVDMYVETVQGRQLKLALVSGSYLGRETYEYKSQKRGMDNDAVVLWLPPDRPQSPGNKRWYRVDDLIPVLKSQFLGEHGVWGRYSVG